MKEIIEIIKHFDISGEIIEIKKLNSGHINTTFRVTVNEKGVTNYFTLQEINTYVFSNPEGVMNNIVGVTAHIRKKLKEAARDCDRGVLSLISASDGKYYYVDKDSRYWRVYRFIDKSHTLDKVENPNTLYNAGVGFGDFQKQLSDYPMDKLVETIPDFHNTPVRYAQLMDAVEKDAVGRVKNCLPEINFIKERKNEMRILTDLKAKGLMPVRVTHNDTKFNNILIDNESDEALSVIDLDTVMPGLVTDDFGDAIRFAANTADEDETDLSKVKISFELFEAFTKGFLQALEGMLTKIEIEHLVWGAKIITMEIGIRFLADYINGDIYFKIHKENHNLYRARCQLMLAKSIEENFDKLQEIVKKYI